VTQELIERFKGDWTLSRHIFDLDSQWLGRFEGQAIIIETEKGLHYHEEGKLQFGGLTAMTATRDYIWTLPDAKTVRVLFEDGKHFHDFDPTEPRPQATHYCDPDEYDVTYDFRKWPEWRAEWRVEGPKKDYRMVSMYSPEIKVKTRLKGRRKAF